MVRSSSSPSVRSRISTASTRSSARSPTHRAGRSSTPSRTCPPAGWTGRSTTSSSSRSTSPSPEPGTDRVMTGSAGSPNGPPGAGGTVPTCYRHAGRETYIRCSRCERYICPDCMTAAPVGFHCPECVAQGNKSVRQGKTVLGGAVRERGDVVTKTLIGINVVVWLFGLVIGTNGPLARDLALASQGIINWTEVTARFGLVLGSQQDLYSIGIADGEWYRLLTVAFVHEEIWHI